ncbi:hypothetical protein PENTCL1PPCAC_18620, partial [Pristionchus entomophagus]
MLINTTPRMRRLILLAFIPILTSSCYSGYDCGFNGQCFKLVGSGKTSNDAKNYCSSEDSHLPIIRSQTDQDQFFSYASKSYKVWLGLTCNGEKFVWDDGTEANYTNFKNVETCNAANVDNHYYFYPGDGKWYPLGISSDQSTFYCHANTMSWLCDTYHLLQQGKTDDTCYLVNTKITAVPQAEAVCENQRAHISPIHDQALNDFIKRTAVGYGLTNGVHNGLK